MVRPPINGGLHCGIHPIAPCLYRYSCAPAYQRRAPLRQHRRLRPCPVAPGCSRLSTAGSIAAIPAMLGGRQPGRECSRLSTAGSIAACTGIRRRTAGTCVLPPINGGLHCGHRPGDIPAPVVTGAPAYQRRAPLRPYPGSVAAPQVSPCSRLSTAGSIAAMLPPRRPCSRSCAPAYQRRAPLRRDYCPIYVLGKKGVLPPINGGLHCGVPACGSELPGVIVLPPINGGLHCGSFESATLAIYTPGAPAYQRRAPLRPLS